MFKRLLFLLLAGVFFTSCTAARKDLMKTIQEDMLATTTVSLAPAPLQPEAATEKTAEKSMLITAPTVVTSLPFSKYTEIPGIDWKKEIQFSFKEEDVGKFFEFLSKASGLTIVNTGAEVSSEVIKDPQSITAQQQQMAQQMYYQNPQQQQAKTDPSKKIGPLTGTVTVYSKGQVTLEEAFKIMDAVLIGKGYASVISDNVMKIIPLMGAKQNNLRIIVNSDPELALEGDDVAIQIVTLKNLTAAKIRSDLSSMIPVWGMILSNDAANSLIVINSLSNIKNLLKIVDNLDKAAASSPRGVSVYPLKYGSSKTLASVLSQVFTGSAQVTQMGAQRNLFTGQVTSPTTEPITIVSEETSNSIVAVAPPQTLTQIKATMELLDKRQKQVLVEVLIVDVTLNDDFQLGVEYTFPANPVTINDLDYTGTLKGDLALASANPPAFTYTLLRNQTNLLIRSLMKKTKVEVKAAPRILTLDNQKATINVGQQVPNLTGSSTSSSGQVIYTYNYNNVGTILNVTPHINENNLITMAISQTVSKITQTTYFGAPVLDNRQATTSVMVKDGETMVLGGIITDSVSVTENKIPLLGDLPIIGFLFKSETKSTEKTELMMFLTPHIIESARDSGENMKKLNERIEKLDK